MNVALIFAGGTGQRMCGEDFPDIPKQFLEYRQQAIVMYTINHFEQHPDIDSIVVVCLEPWIGHLWDLVEKSSVKKIAAIVPGGLSGQESIYKGLMSMQKRGYPSDTIVLIHDGVRPLITEQLITDNITCTQENGNAITVAPAIETIALKSKDESGHGIEKLIDRSLCMVVRAPQTFKLGEAIDAHTKAAQQDRMFIDTASMMEYYKTPLFLVEGPPENIKITTPVDYYMFCALLDAQEKTKTEAE
jgi:2-C-methyl-D-erythritol 4-phosphate cytidylyltransferase